MALLPPVIHLVICLLLLGAIRGIVCQDINGTFLYPAIDSAPSPTFTPGATINVKWSATAEPTALSLSVANNGSLLQQWNNSQGLPHREDDSFDAVVPSNVTLDQFYYFGLEFDAAQGSDIPLFIFSGYFKVVGKNEPTTDASGSTPTTTASSTSLLALGLGLGVPLGVLFLAALAAALFFWRRSRAARASGDGFGIETSKEVHAQVSQQHRQILEE